MLSTSQKSHVTVVTAALVKGTHRAAIASREYRRNAGYAFRLLAIASREYRRNAGYAFRLLTRTVAAAVSPVVRRSLSAAVYDQHPAEVAVIARTPL